METLEQNIHKVIKQVDMPSLSSEDVQIYLDAKLGVKRSRGHVRDVLKKMALAGELKRVWVEQTDKRGGHWLYTLPPCENPVVSRMRAWHKKHKCKWAIGGCACGEDK